MTTELKPRTTPRSQSWGQFYRVGAVTAFLTVLVMVSEIFITFLPGGGRVAPEDVTVLTWFDLFHQSWFLGLRNLGFINMIAAVLLLPTVLAYRLARRWSSRADFCLVVLFIFFLLSFALAIAVPKAALIGLFPVLIGSAAWIAAALLRRDQHDWPLDLGSMLTALAYIMAFLPLFPGAFMGDGAKSVAILSAILPLLLAAILPANDGLLVRPRAAPKLAAADPADVRKAGG